LVDLKRFEQPEPSQAQQLEFLDKWIVARARHTGQSDRYSPGCILDRYRRPSGPTTEFGEVRERA
jgi:hypothetical protein